jgi:hypothetical protein
VVSQEPFWMTSCFADCFADNFGTIVNIGRPRSVLSVPISSPDSFRIIGQH